MKHLLVVFSSQSGHTRAMCDAVCEGTAEEASAVDTRLRFANEADLDDLLWAEALLIGTPENFGYMSGLIKDFLDRTYYPAEGKTVGLPYALFISAGNDGSGAARAIERIATGYGWRAIAEPLILKGELTADGLKQCRELGAVVAAGLASGIF
ncbi:flavodoxin family protein [Solimonas marina]|uniref:Flavodoxin n=1 Tax=Solimonas marina TaxID=2714601 RepID=A0A969WCB4_9GAMM|nr:NAD(P)H-dependent oxidoreductase [Solimonas marina]NKF23924.1 flavodoxin [Solimonas marina]